MKQYITNSKGYKTFQIFNTLSMWAIVIVTLYPFVYLLAGSFSSESAMISGKVALLPVEFSSSAYKIILHNKLFWITYKNTLIYTTLQTAIGLFMTVICAYPLSRNHLKGRGIIMKMMVFTMFFSGGLIPNYLLIVNLKLIDTIGAIVLPGAIGVWNMIIMRTFFQGIPSSLEDAGHMDGLNPIGILFRIYVPLSKPVLATVGLFIAVWTWNDYFYPLIYLNSMEKYPVTVYLRNLLIGSAQLNSSTTLTIDDVIKPNETLKAAVIMLVTVPILCVYPFIQKYFVKGVMIGSIKG